MSNNVRLIKQDFEYKGTTFKLDEMALVRVALPPATLAAPKGRLVPIDEVEQALPHTARIDPAERERLIRDRRRQMTRLLLR